MKQAKYTDEDRKRWLEEWRRFNGTHAEFARHLGLPLSTVFYAGINRLLSGVQLPDPDGWASEAEALTMFNPYIHKRDVHNAHARYGVARKKEEGRWVYAINQIAHLVHLGLLAGCRSTHSPKRRTRDLVAPGSCLRCDKLNRDGAACKRYHSKPWAEYSFDEGNTYE